MNRGGPCKLTKLILQWVKSEHDGCYFAYVPEHSSDFLNLDVIIVKERGVVVGYVDPLTNKIIKLPYRRGKHREISVYFNHRSPLTQLRVMVKTWHDGEGVGHNEADPRDPDFFSKIEKYLGLVCSSDGSDVGG